MICNKCIGSLNVAWQFKQQCENSDMKLRQYFGNSAQHLQVTPDLDGFNIGIKEEHNLFNLTSQDNQILTHELPQQHTHPPTLQPAPTVPPDPLVSIIL